MDATESRMFLYQWHNIVVIFSLLILTNNAYSPGEIGRPFDFVSLICLNRKREIVGFSPLTLVTLNFLR